MKALHIDYFDDKTLCKGYIAHPKEGKNLPVVLIASTWLGLNRFIIEKAHEIANLGYIAFAIDVYGEGKTTESTDQAAEWMAPFFLDRAMLRKRLQAAYTQASKIPGVNVSLVGARIGARIGAIGFCFGGLAVIELLRSGAFLKAAVSIHGSLTDTLKEKKATLAPSTINPQSSFLLLHGYKDPLVPMENVVEFQKELSEANIDWQSHIYGLAGHAFTNPALPDKEPGNSPTKFCFEPLASARSFQTLTAYLKEKLV